MKQTFIIDGMSCNGCRTKVENALNAIEGLRAEVTLNPPEAIIEMNDPISLVHLQEVLSLKGNYSIRKMSCCGHTQPRAVPKKPVIEVIGATYYCPMHCEGDKVYSKAGDCPVCGMDLVPAAAANINEDATLNKLVKKLKIAVAFTLPIFIIAMSEMIPNNPLYQIMEVQYWNWVQCIFSIPVVFYACWLFFERAWRSVLTWNLNMFTLIGIGSGVAWLFSVIALIFPDVFPDQFKTHSGTVYIYFEAATVILTLVLLGQVLEAKAHGKTNSAIKELLNLAPNKAIKITNGLEQEVSIDDILKGDLLRVKPGEKIPVDGFVHEGESAIDESMISGEPLPISKKAGDTVIAGTINGNKSFIMRTDKIGSETLLAQIIKW